MALLKKLWEFALQVLGVFASILGALLGKKQPSQNCKCLCPPALKQPDPFLYSQYYLMSLGLPVTWGNSDITLFNGVVPIDPHDLVANTPYTVRARIWNGSTQVPVINLKVDFSYLSFGMGTESHPIGSSTTDLNVKGLAGCPAFAFMTWTTPATPGHYCIQVLVEPPDDSNWANNLGQLNTEVAQAQSPAVFSFAVGNHVGPRPRAVRFMVDTYTIPPLRVCSQLPMHTGPRSISKIAPPVPDGWTVTLTPNEINLAAGEERQVQAAITPPAGFSGSMPFNVTGWDDNGPMGGVTLTVEVS